jgi:hypothetical protein
MTAAMTAAMIAGLPSADPGQSAQPEDERTFQCWLLYRYFC